MQIFMLEIFINDFVSHHSYPVNNVLGSQCFALGFVLILLQIEVVYNLPSHPGGLWSWSSVLIPGCPTLVMEAPRGLDKTGDGFASAGTPGLSWGRARPSHDLSKTRGLWLHWQGKERVSAAGITGV